MTPEGGSVYFEPGGKMNPGKLRFIADHLDLFDKLITNLAPSAGLEYDGGTEMQDDLRRWADELEAQTSRGGDDG